MYTYTRTHMHTSRHSEAPSSTDGIVLSCARRSASMFLWVWVKRAVVRVCLSVCLSVRRSVCLFGWVCIFICLAIYLSICPSTWSGAWHSISTLPGQCHTRTLNFAGARVERIHSHIQRKRHPNRPNIGTQRHGVVNSEPADVQRRDREQSPNAKPGDTHPESAGAVLFLFFLSAELMTVITGFRHLLIRTSFCSTILVTDVCVPCCP